MNEVICIDDEGCHLTFGRTYNALCIENGWVRVVNDLGIPRDYLLSQFKTNPNP